MSRPYLNYNLAAGNNVIFVMQVLGIESNNMGAAVKMPQVEWDRLTRCIGPHPRTPDLFPPESVRGQLKKYCAGDSYESCMNSGGVQRLMQLAVEKGCGNCQEKVAIAIMLLNSWGVPRLDFMILNEHHGAMEDGGIDHAFVAIGRLKGTNVADPATWGPDAVVCDPWHDYGKVYPAAEIQRKLFRGHFGYTGPLMPHSIYRLE